MLQDFTRFHLPFWIILFGEQRWCGIVRTRKKPVKLCGGIMSGIPVLNLGRLFAEALVPNRCQDISYHHDDCFTCIICSILVEVQPLNKLFKREVSIGIHIVKIRWSHYCCIFIMEIPIARNTVFILKQGPGRLTTHWSLWCRHVNVL